MGSLCSLPLFIGRLLLSVIFILSGVAKFVDYHSYVQYMAAKGMTLIPFFLILAAIIEIVGGILLIVGYKVRLSAGILILYLIPVTAIFHDFWMMEDAGSRQMQMIEFLKNIAIMGGLFYVLGTGAGKWSLENCCNHSSCSGC